ncbi:MAG: tetratricopeptide repeat protein, partial [Planctomycetales bacterium]|nr:tetratricopeptide repeat protein [Planctomycetales bacterium]
LPWLDQLIAAEPDHVGYRYQRAKLLEALGRPDESQAEWKRLAKLRPDDPDFAARSRGETWEPVT